LQFSLRFSNHGEHIFNNFTVITIMMTAKERIIMGIDLFDFTKINIMRTFKQ